MQFTVIRLYRPWLWFMSLLLLVPLASAQAKASLPAAATSLTLEANETARILQLAPVLQTLSSSQASAACGAPPSAEARAVRQDLLEMIQAAALDIDSVLSMINFERDKLGELRTTLQSRRDRTVGRLNAAALITGAGFGVAVSATQFSNLGSKTQNAGDIVGIGSGTASTLLSIIGLGKQSGPKGTVGLAPNMLAPLFDEPPTLNTYYPPSVLEYLHSVPPTGPPNAGTRLKRLRAIWIAAGHLPADGSSDQRQKILALSSSLNPAVKVSIDDLTARIAMLADVAGNVSLMKRDLATLMRSYRSASPVCTAP